MGYTHYWKKSDTPQDAWDKLRADAERLIRATPVRIQFEYDDPAPPEVSNTRIRFNGVGDYRHETFCLEKNEVEFDFFKTARKPYDVVVTAILACAKEHLGDGIKVSSDGDSSEWDEGLEFAKATLGRIVPFPCSESLDGDGY